MRFSGRLTLAAVTACAVLALVAACSDKSSPTSPEIKRDTQGHIVMGECTTLAHLDTLASGVFGAGSANLSLVRGKLDALGGRVAAYDVPGAQAQATDIINYVKQKVAAGGVPGTEAQINEFVSSVSCYAGMTPDTWLVVPSNAPQIHTTSDGNSGVYLEPGTVTTPTLLTITPIDSGEASPLITKLDQYPVFVHITSSSALTKPAIIALCPTADVPAGVRERLRLGHQSTDGFEITPRADGSFLNCSNSLAQSRRPTFLRTLARLVLPKMLYAASFEVSGIGGSATEFSPFGVVDPEVSFSGGVGGSATEFIRGSSRAGARADTRATQGGRGNLVQGGTCTQVSATVSTALEPECRPLITLTTPNGTPLQSVPITWSVSAGGGTIAPSVVASQACGVFSASASTTTDTQGKAGVCWMLGQNAGANKSTATPSAGGDVPEGTIFNPPIITFTATGLAITPDAAATGGTFAFDNQAHPGSGSCTNGLAPELTYSSGSAPVAIGEHILTVTCGAHNGAFTPATATATISILATAPSATITCPASVVYNAVPQSPCSATVTAPGLSLTPALTYTANIDAGTATASLSMPATGNYGAVSATRTFAIAKASSTTTVTCAPTSLSFTGAAITPCTGVATGIGAFSIPLTATYSPNVNVGTVTANADFAGNENFLPSTGYTTFTITRAATTASVQCPASRAYTGAAIAPCTASVSGPGGLASSLTVAYQHNVQSGTASATAAYAGTTNYLPSDGVASFAITQLAATATAGGATITLGDAVPSMACSVAGLLAGESGAVTCTTGVPSFSSPGSYTTTPILSPANPANYSVALVTGTLTVNAPAGPYVQENCFEALVEDGVVDDVHKGASVPVACTLKLANGTAVTWASGNLVVYDIGTTGNATPVAVLSMSNAFAHVGAGRYLATLNTSAAAFVAGHQYSLVATWSDGSTTNGAIKIVP